MFNSLRDTLKALQQNQISSVELAQFYWQRIAQSQHLNAFISVEDETFLLDQARLADERIQSGKHGALEGLLVAHKDLFCTLRLKTTCASKMLADYQSPYAATIVEKLTQSGAITIGKTNMDEFAMGSSNESSYFGAVKNPWDTDRVPGGSSGGAAAAVAASLVSFATASDTGGSIRQPAAFCGVCGIKPTYGLLSRYGMVAYASSLDQGGVIARSADDLALVLSQMVGFDTRDSTSIDRTAVDYGSTLTSCVKGLKIGLPQGLLAALDKPMQQVLQEAIRVFELEGALIQEIALPSQKLWIPCYYLIACAEASSNLSRYDGLRFGYRSQRANSLRELITASRTESFGEEVKRRIFTGTYALSSGYFDAYYLQALKIRRLIQEEFLNAFKQVDIILSPTTPTPAFKIGEKQQDPMELYLADIFTVGANLGGFPALSIPAGFINGLPVGMQLSGNHFSEARLLSTAHHYQQITNWHLSRPQG